MLGLLLSVATYAQENSEGAATKNTQQLTNNMTPGKASSIGPGSTIFIIPPKTEDRKGSPYLFEQWKKGVVFVKSLNKSYQFDYLKYDLMNNDIELKIDGQVKVIPDKEVKEFVIQDDASGQVLKFIRLDRFSYETTPLSGFGQVITEGKVSLIKHSYTEIKEANYRVDLNVGDKFDTILQREKYYFAYKNKIYSANKKKEVIAFYAAQDKDAKSFIKENKLNVQNEVELAQLILHFNQ